MQKMMARKFALLVRGGDDGDNHRVPPIGRIRPLVLADWNPPLSDALTARELRA